MSMRHKNMAYRRAANSCEQGRQMALIIRAGINNSECLCADEIGAGTGEGEGAAIRRDDTPDRGPEPFGTGRGKWLRAVERKRV